MRKLLVYIWLFLAGASQAQVELAVQEGHSDDIILLEFSHSTRYLASLAKNNEIIIWEIQHEKSIASFEIPPEKQVEGMKFDTDERKLKVRLQDTTTMHFDIVTSEYTSERDVSDTLYRKKDFYYHEESNFEVDIHEGAIRKKRRDKRFRKYKLSVNYLNAPFNAFDVSPTADLIVGVAQDNRTYVHSFRNGHKKHVLGGHYSQCNDVRFSMDGRYFATAGRDRSIIIWDSKTMEMDARLATNAFRKKTANFSHDGDRIYVGDELGFIYEIDFRAAFPAIRVVQPNLYAVNKIVRANSEYNSGYYLASSNNYIYYKNNLASEKAIAKYEFRDNAILKAKKRILQSVFNIYQEPFGEPDQLKISPDNKKLLYTGKADVPNVSVAFLENKKVKHFYNTSSWKQWTDVDWVTNDHFIAISDSSNVLYQWKSEKRNFLIKTDTLPVDIKAIEYISDNYVWVSAYKYGQFIYNMETRKIEQISEEIGENLFKKDRFMVICNLKHEMHFYDLVGRKTYNVFKGHSDRITDVNVHPDGNLFVSSSDDGTVKLWSLEEQNLITTMIPFRNEEFVFVTDDNYYMITKGAMSEIGFKYEGQYFNPEQFDLKYNRPDIVLDRMGYSDSSIIKAYNQAYLKRLKKLNFTEDMLAADFHLPNVEIRNELNLPDETADTMVALSLLMSDTKYELDRVNIYVNDVAIHGTNGIDLREFKVQQHNLDVHVPLSRGKNKIEIGVLNQKGVESYKKEVNIRSTSGKEKPDLYIASLGVSKHKDSNYDLEYADKDATDISEMFRKSPYFDRVNVRAYTNEQVNKNNMQNLKPFLEEADINDVVIVFVAGHGVLDDEFDYYFASYDMDFSEPSKKGIPYSDIESLLDGITALKKLLFIDTCHSGELDKDDVKEGTEQNNEDGELIFRHAGKIVEIKDNPFGLKNTNELMKSIFTDLRKGTGATVISSSGGAEYSIEGGQYKNGLFTYCMIQGLQDKKADKDKDGKVTVAELQTYVSAEVKKLSGGIQTPTSRRRNDELDYRLW